MLGRAPRPRPEAPARPPPLTRERVAGMGCERSERHGVTILTRSDTDQAVNTFTLHTNSPHGPTGPRTHNRL